MKEQETETDRKTVRAETDRERWCERQTPLPEFSEKPVQKEEPPKKDTKPHDSDLLNRATLNCDISAGTEETDATPYKQNATEKAHTKHKTSNLQYDLSFNWKQKR